MRRSGGAVVVPEKAAKPIVAPGAGQMLERRLLSMEEIAKRRGVSGDTILAWLNTRGMPDHEAGRLWRFEKVEVDVWVREGGAAASKLAQGGRG